MTKEKIRKLKREKELQDLVQLLATPQGQRFVWRLLSDCGVYHLSYVASDRDTCFNEGKRNIGLKLLADISEACPEILLSMMKSAKLEKEKETL